MYPALILFLSLVVSGGGESKPKPEPEPKPKPTISKPSNPTSPTGGFSIKTKPIKK